MKLKTPLKLEIGGGGGGQGARAGDRLVYPILLLESLGNGL